MPPAGREVPRRGGGRETYLSPKLRITTSLSPPPASRDRLRGRAPLSLRDISPRSGESPSQMGPYSPPRVLFIIPQSAGKRKGAKTPPHPVAWPGCGGYVSLFPLKNCFTNYSTAFKAWSRSAMISSMCSVPMDRRMVFSWMPTSSSSSGDSWAWVVVAG